MAFPDTLQYLILFTCLCPAICGIWVLITIRRSFTPTLVFDLVYNLNFIALYGWLYLNPTPPLRTDLPFYPLLILVYAANAAFVSMFLLRWRDTPSLIEKNLFRIKVVLSFLGLYTVLPLVLYYLRLSYIPKYATGQVSSLPGNAVAVPAVPQAPPAPAAAQPTSQAVMPQGERKIPASSAITSPPSELMDIYGDWHFIGRGGFARVFKARRRDGMYVAVKIPLFMDPAIGKSFISEIQNWTRLSHRNIVRILDYNIIPIPYFEMELCDGSLDQFRKPVNPLLAASLVFDICEGLKYCHAEKIVHRDLKPQNILMKNAIPKLSDWGLSKVLSESNISSTMISFSPYYAAPEQVKGIAKDQRVDIWQAGVILYELTTGVLPFKGENVVEIIANITTRDPAPPSRLVPGTAGLEPVILKCLRKDPMNRFQSVVELQAALGGYLKETFLTLLDESLAIHDNPKTAVSCAELVQILLKMNDATMAGEFASFLKNYVDGELSSEVTSLVEKINRVPHSAPTEIPDDLLNDAKVLVSQVKKRRNKKYD